MACTRTHTHTQMSCNNAQRHACTHTKTRRDARTQKCARRPRPGPRQNAQCQGEQADRVQYSLSVCLCLSLSLSLSVCLSVSACPSVYLSLCQSVCLSICGHTHACKHPLSNQSPESTRAHAMKKRRLRHGAAGRCAGGLDLRQAPLEVLLGLTAVPPQALDLVDSCSRMLKHVDADAIA